MDGMKSMHSMKMTDDVDRDFAAMMIKHHEQASAVSKIEQDKGKNPVPRVDAGDRAPTGVPVSSSSSSHA